MKTELDDQFRIEQVQILNWGAYGGLQVMHAGRRSTAILGPSGRGKSTLLDAIASVVMPNPQEFNQAARDDQGKKRERTVYSYARGLTVNVRDENRRSSTPTYLRPPGQGGFVSGVAITWATGHHQHVTAFRLAWVTKDATDNDAIAANTVYGFVHDAFDLSKLDGLRPARAGTPPLTPTTLEPLIDVARGDIADRRQGPVHAKMRRVMRMGATEESQALAMQLLRRAQASKGIFSINDLFTRFVLTQPKALERWDNTVEHYTEASRLYDEFELARRKLTVLRDLAMFTMRYRTAGELATLKRRILRSANPSEAGTNDTHLGGPRPASANRLRIWHAAKTAAWAQTAEEDIKLEMALAAEAVQSAAIAQASAKATYDLAVEALQGAGADRSTLMRERISTQEAKRDEVQKRRDQYTRRLARVDQVLPTSAGDLTLLQESLGRLLDDLQVELSRLVEQREDRAAEKRKYASRIVELRKELRRLEGAAGNIPPDFDDRRRQIAEGVGLPVSELPFVGELIDIAPEHLGWERAILTIVRPLAQDLAVAQRHFPAVRAWVNSHNIGGLITLAPVVPDLPMERSPSATVPEMLNLTPGPYAGWVSRQLQRYAYLCVERDTDLAGATPPGVVGKVTRAGMRTGRGDRVTKDDRPIRYRWIGQDNRDLRLQLAEEVDALQRAYDTSDLTLATARDAEKQQAALIDDIEKLREELTWVDIDLAPLEQLLETLRASLAATDTPEQRKLREDHEEALRQHGIAERKTENAKDRAAFLDRQWGAIVQVQDLASDQLDVQPALDADEAATLASLPYQAPDLDLDLTARDADARVARAVEASYKHAEGLIETQIADHDAQRETATRSLLTIISAYRGINDRTAREVDDDIASLPTLEAIQQQLETDDLPRAKSKWLGKVDADLNQGLRTLLSQIQVDARDITRGLDPINQVLGGVEFRDGSHLSIEPVEQQNSDLREFRDIVLAYTRENPLGADLGADEAKVEASFVQLRRNLARLTDPSRVGESWRKRVFDARQHVEFRAIEVQVDGTEVIHEGVSGMSGGEGQELIAFILGAALRYRLGEGGESLPAYASVILDEGFVKADSDYTGRSLRALQTLGFQLIVGAPREKATAFEDYVDHVAYINTDPTDHKGVRIYRMTIHEALALEEEAS